MTDQPAPRERTLAEAATSALHQMILSGQIAEGSHLRLNELASALDMSVMPVREAIRRLAALGLVELVPHKGAWVRGLSVEDFRDTHETRLALELLAVDRAARRFTPEDEQTAEAFLLEYEELARTGDGPGARRAHKDFHFTLIRASGSVWLPRTIEPIWQNSERYRFASAPSPEALRALDREHRSILDACRRHDPDTAVAALHAHLERAFERMLSRLHAEAAASLPVPDLGR
jgi:DNA-binding GntR family transcriptional regulator